MTILYYAMKYAQNIFKGTPRILRSLAGCLTELPTLISVEFSFHFGFL